MSRGAVQAAGRLTSRSEGPFINDVSKQLRIVTPSHFVRISRGITHPQNLVNFTTLPPSTQRTSIMDGPKWNEIFASRASNARGCLDRPFLNGVAAADFISRGNEKGIDEN